MASMGRLILLKLQPLHNSSAGYSSQPSTPPSRPLPPIPSKPQRDSEQRMPSAVVIPRMQEEWRMVLDEVRSLYLSRRHKQCASRCIQLLEVAPDLLPSIYCVYLSFYGAMCLELTGRPLATDSPERLALFQLARVHYQNAEHFTWEAESEYARSNRDRMSRSPLKTHQRLRSCSSEISTTSYRSSIGSNSDSVFSCNSSSSTTSSIPSSVPKIPTETSGLLLPRPLRVKKSVSFYSEFPKPPSSCRAKVKESTSELSKPCGSEPAMPPSRCKRGFTNPKAPTSASCPTATTTPSPFPPPHEIRFQTHLSSLSAQLKTHIRTIESLISRTLSAHHQNQQRRQNGLQSERQSERQNECQNEYQNQDYHHQQQSHQQQQNVYKSPTSSNLRKLHSRANLPTIFDTQCLDHGHDHGDGSQEQQQQRRQESRIRERAARIEVLRQRGHEWKMGTGRFDPSRYERVCEETLMELRDECESGLNNGSVKGR